MVETSKALNEWRRGRDLNPGHGLDRPVTPHIRSSMKIEDGILPHASI